MTTEYQATPEERTFHRLVDGEWASLSEAARSVLRQANEAAQKLNMFNYYGGYHPQEYEDDMQAMSRAAAELAEADLEGLTKIWRSALAAASSVDPYDYETLVGWRTYRGQLHRYYKQFSSLVEDAEGQKRREESYKEIRAEQEPIDPQDIPF